MSKRLMFAGCLHKRHKDITTIEGYTECTRAVQNSLMEEIEKNNIDIFVSMGDWYDKGYGTEIMSSLADTEIDRKMAEQLKGEFYGVIGNHIRLNLDTNPELFLIQPHEKFKTRRKVNRKEQIIRTPDKLIINGVQISFMHYNQYAHNALDYKPKREDGVKYHIALFHTPLVIPSSELYKLNMQYDASSNSSIQQCMEGVDLAIVGDIHKPLGQFDVTHPDGKITTMIVPGSLTNTNAGMGSRHNNISIPIVEISDSGTVKLEYLFFDLHTNMLLFKMKDESSKDNKLKTLRGNNVRDLYESSNDGNIVEALHDDMVSMSLNLFMRRQGYTKSDVDIVNSIINDPQNIDAVLKSYTEGILNVT